MQNNKIRFTDLNQNDKIDFLCRKYLRGAISENNKKLKSIITLTNGCQYTNHGIHPMLSTTSIANKYSYSQVSIMKAFLRSNKEFPETNFKVVNSADVFTMYSFYGFQNYIIDNFNRLSKLDKVYDTNLFRDLLILKDCKLDFANNNQPFMYPHLFKMSKYNINDKAMCISLRNTNSLEISTEDLQVLQQSIIDKIVDTFKAHNAPFNPKFVTFKDFDLSITNNAKPINYDKDNNQLTSYREIENNLLTADGQEIKLVKENGSFLYKFADGKHYDGVVFNQDKSVYDDRLLNIDLNLTNNKQLEDEIDFYGHNNSQVFGEDEFPLRTVEKDGQTIYIDQSGRQYYGNVYSEDRNIVDDQIDYSKQDWDNTPVTPSNDDLQYLGGKK